MKTATKLRIVVLVAGVAVVETLCRVGVIKHRLHKGGYAKRCKRGACRGVI